MANRKKGLRGAIVGLLVLILLIPCSVLLYDRVKVPTETKVECYYMMSDGKMKPIERKLKGREQDAVLLEALSQLKNGQPSDGVEPSVPEGVDFLSARMERDTAFVDISDGYGKLKGIQEVICRSSIVWTLTSLDFVENVELTAEGQPLRNSAGEEYGPMSRQNVWIDSEISAQTTEYAILRLYFANQNVTDLAMEERVVEVNANQAREKTILEQLIAGPMEKEHHATMPADTKILDATTTADGTCYVNLSQEFVTKQSDNPAEELLTVYSVVNSLCELDHVDKVQFLINGEKLEEYKGVLDFKTPFTAIGDLKSAALQPR